MGAEWRFYAGQRYLHVDYQGCRSDEDLIAVYEEQARLMRTSPMKSRVLADLTGVSIGSDFMHHVTARGKERGQELLEKNAIIGVTGLKRILADGFRTLSGLGDKVRSFEEFDSAMEWLVE